METTVKLVKIGSGFFVAIPAFFRNQLELKEGDLLKIDVKKIDNDTIQNI